MSKSRAIPHRLALVTRGAQIPRLKAVRVRSPPAGNCPILDKLGIAKPNRRCASPFLPHAVLHAGARGKGDVIFQDNEAGLEGETLDEAVVEAEVAAAQMISDKLRFGDPVAYRRFEVVDGEQQVQATFSLDDLLDGIRRDLPTSPRPTGTRGGL